MTKMTEALNDLGYLKENLKPTLMKDLGMVECMFNDIETVIKQNNWQTIDKFEPKTAVIYLVGAYSKKYKDDFLVATAYKMNCGWLDSKGENISFEPEYIMEINEPKGKK